MIIYLDFLPPPIPLLPIIIMLDHVIKIGANVQSVN